MNENNLNTNPGTGVSLDGGNHKGSLIGSIIVVVLLIIGAFYFWSNRTPAPVTPATETTETAPAPMTDPSTEALNQQSANDDLTSLEADVNATDLSGLDAEMGTIEAEFAN
jgi:uncharacterized protein with FMN-binding domain